MVSIIKLISGRTAEIVPPSCTAPIIGLAAPHFRIENRASKFLYSIALAA